MASRRTAGRTTGTGTISFLLAASGALMGAAAAQRWWPACPVGDYGDPACLRLQDHRYDFVLPMAPWVPAGDAAVLAGLSLLLLGTAVTALPLLLRPRRRPASVWWLCAALGTCQLVAGLSTLAAGLLEQPGPRFWEPLVMFVWLGWPVALTITAMLMVDHVRRPGVGWLGLIVLLTASTPLGQALLVPLVTGYVSPDTTPWSEAWGGACLLLAALAVWPAAYRRPRSAPLRRPVPASRAVAARLDVTAVRPAARLGDTVVLGVDGRAGPAVEESPRARLRGHRRGLVVRRERPVDEQLGRTRVDR